MEDHEKCQIHQQHVFHNSVKQTKILAKSKAQAHADVHGMHVTHQKSLLSQHVRLYKYAAKRVSRTK